MIPTNFVINAKSFTTCKTCQFIRNLSFPREMMTFTFVLWKAMDKWRWNICIQQDDQSHKFFLWYNIFSDSSDLYKARMFPFSSVEKVNCMCIFSILLHKLHLRFMCVCFQQGNVYNTITSLQNSVISCVFTTTNIISIEGTSGFNQSYYLLFSYGPTNNGNIIWCVRWFVTPNKSVF